MAVTTYTEQGDRFAALAREAIERYERNAARYKRRVAMQALIAHALIYSTFAVLILALAVIGWWLFGRAAPQPEGAIGSVARPLMMLLGAGVGGVLIWLVWEALRARPAAIRGYPLSAAEFPEFHAAVAELRGQLAALPVHQILLTADFGLRLVRTARLGVLGWHANTLVVGLPLLLAFAPEHAKALLAHEIAHLSRSNGRQNARLYRQRLAWERTREALEQSRSRLSRPLREMFDAFVARFSALSFAAARANEFEADAAAADLTSPRDAALALVSVHVHGSALQARYWEPLIRAADYTVEAAPNAFTGLHRYLRESVVDRIELLARIRKAMATPAREADPMPSLRDRLEALAAPPALPPRVVLTSAADAWLGPRLPRVLADFDAVWQIENQVAWSERHADAQQARIRLEHIERTPIESRTPAEHWELLALTERLLPEADTLPLYERFLAAHPDHVEARFAVGRRLALQGDHRAIEYLESVLDSFHHVIPACEAAYRLFKERGDEHQLAVWEARASSQLERYERAAAERMRLSRGDFFFAPTVDEAWKEALARTVAVDGRIRRAWISQKVVKQLPEQPVYVIVVESGEWFTESEEILEALRRRVALPGKTFVVGKRSDLSTVVRRTIKAGTRIL